MSSSYYEILGLVSSCSSEEIKKAYRRLAVRWHPDKNNGSAEATEMFKTISEAYDTLSDPVRRRQYDQELNMDNTSSSSSRGYPPFQQHSADPFQQHARAAHFSHRHAQDIFDSFFRDFGGAGIFDDDEIFGGPFARSGSGGFSRQNSRQQQQQSSMGGQSPFDSFGLGGFGMRMGMGMGMGPSLFDPHMSHSQMSSSSSSRSYSSSSTTMHGSGRSGKSVSTSTYIDSSGRRCTKTTTTVYRPDGSAETHTEESIDGASSSSSSGRIGFGGGSSVSSTSAGFGDRLGNGPGFGWRGNSPR
jgi:DnaJ family protein B protein 6